MTWRRGDITSTRNYKGTTKILSGRDKFVDGSKGEAT